MAEGFTPLTGSLGKTAYDDMLLPGGGRLGDEKNLAAVLVDLGVPGASVSKGRADNAEAYAAHVRSISKAASDNAVADWLANGGAQ